MTFLLIPAEDVHPRDSLFFSSVVSLARQFLILFKYLNPFSGAQTRETGSWVLGFQARRSVLPFLLSVAV